MIYKKHISSEEDNELKNNVYDLKNKFKLDKQFTIQQKIEKFNNLIEEYERLMNYRKMLYVILTKNSFSTEFNEEGLIVNKTKDLSIENIIRINEEINLLNSAISLIETFILDDPQLIKKTSNNENTESDTKKN